MFDRVVRIIVDVTLFVLLGGDAWEEMFLKGEASPAMVKLWREARGDRLEGSLLRFGYYLEFCRALSVLRSYTVFGALVSFIAWWAAPRFFWWVCLPLFVLIVILLGLSGIAHLDGFRSFYPGIGRDFRRLWRSVAGEMALSLKQISSLGEAELKELAIKRLGQVIDHCRISPGSVWRYEELKLLLASVGLISSFEVDEVWRDAMKQTSTLRSVC